MSARNLFAWFASVLLISLASRWQALEADAVRCALDGERIVPVYRVDLVEAEGESVSFCSIRCATAWPDVPAEASWQVRDEVTGRVIDARKACFVESSVVTVPSHRERRHTFENWADAHLHLTQYGGSRIPNPFAGECCESSESGPAQP